MKESFASVIITFLFLMFPFMLMCLVSWFTEDTKIGRRISKRLLKYIKNK